MRKTIIAIAAAAALGVATMATTAMAAHGGGGGGGGHFGGGSVGEIRMKAVLEHGSVRGGDEIERLRLVGIHVEPGSLE